jgi:hypothetical protein
LDLEAGTVVAKRYRVTRPLGRGGMGEVFAAENIRTGRPVAVKLLRAESKTKTSAVARFRREARAAGSIQSDHVTEILDVEEDDEHGICLVFELLEGESLIDRLKRTGPIPFDELHGIIEQVWQGLSDAHRAGVIHRDLKPSNVYLEQRPDGSIRVKILDFGISKLPKEMGGETLTEMGQSLGTFSFMPPEQIGKAKTVDHRADIYACATLIYQALSGQLPYAARNILVMVEMKSKTEPRRISEVMGKDIDPRLEDFLANALARDPDKRFQTAAEALAEWRKLKPQPHNGAGAGQGHMGQGQHQGQANQGQAHQGQAHQGQAHQGQAHQGQAHQGQAHQGYGGGPAAPSPAAGYSVPIAPLIAESTSDTAATIAIPVQRLLGDSPTGGGLHHAAPEGHARTMLQRTLPVMSRGKDESSPQLGPPHGGYDGEAQSPFGQTVAMRKDPPNQGFSSTGSGPAPTPAAGTPVGSTISTEPSSAGGPASQDLTRVYRPNRGSEVDLREPERQEPAPQRSALSFVLGAIAFALVGFGIVAVVLEYVRTGSLPW